LARVLDTAAEICDESRYDPRVLDPYSAQEFRGMCVEAKHYREGVLPPMSVDEAISLAEKVGWYAKAVGWEP
jgi:hypothetical protein